VGQIPADGVGKEIIIRTSTDLQTGARLGCASCTRFFAVRGDLCGGIRAVLFVQSGPPDDAAVGWG
jgi:hypothetical protein